MMKTVCNKNMCTGCMACLDVCPKKAITVKDGISSYNAIIDEKLCVDCNACHDRCQVNNTVKKSKPQIWYQGWADDKDLRLRSSSGGFATEIVNTFLKSNGIVFCCIFEQGKFIYKKFCPGDDVSDISGSKYVKSNPQGVYKKVKEVLKLDKKVLFIGLPCHVAALKCYLGDVCKKNLYTIDLICHGTPSPKMLNLSLEQYCTQLNSVKQIRFRKKDHFQVAINVIADEFRFVATKGILDSYMIGFLDGLFYTDNCYECKYASIDRVSDLTLGDSWGSLLPLEERRKGISLALCQNEKGEELLIKSHLHLEAVDLEVAKNNNKQLCAPSTIPIGRDKFFEGIKSGHSFNSMVWRVYPAKKVKQIIKKILITLHLFEG